MIGDVEVTPRRLHVLLSFIPIPRPRVFHFKSEGVSVVLSFISL